MPIKKVKKVKKVKNSQNFNHSKIYVPAGLVGVFPAPPGDVGVPENAPKADEDPPDAEPAPPKIEDAFEFPAKAVFPVPPPPKMD